MTGIHLVAVGAICTTIIVCALLWAAVEIDKRKRNND